ncbi:MAG: tRNA preQ1(34) S-adenosylmethionine ribosyltransferase-isomerase QueA [Clostridia bacterium]|nr:tRNA preQ1(34) S-adenosylmethionine ribosyltransferase-isomerase QueA [Deltaproteobacteria bacterium]
MSLSMFDYALPQEQIAQEPVRPRDSSKLLVLDRFSGAVAHYVFRELPSLLHAGDLLIVNKTKVIPARVRVNRPSGGKVELLFLEPLGGDLHSATRWRTIGKPGDALRPGKTLIAPDGSILKVDAREGTDAIISAETPLWNLLEQAGEVPLPPYITRREGPVPRDADDYQTIFAQEPGAVAAPTASLHFTDDVLSALAEHGVERAEVVLHVGAGTFLPVREEHADDVRAHQMHAEVYEIPDAAVNAIEAARSSGRRIIAVGTTCVRALETWAVTGQRRGASRLFIYPGFEFRVVQAMVTNFHVPRSTLLMLVSAFAGREAIMAAYGEAVAKGYRFFSYGDAMFIG